MGEWLLSRRGQHDRRMAFVPEGQHDRRMAFVPEGQHDSSQARSAWNHEENSAVPAGRLNRSQLRSDASNKHSVKQCFSIYLAA
jgi:hypothetical protein